MSRLLICFKIQRSNKVFINFTILKSTNLGESVNNVIFKCPTGEDTAIWKRHFVVGEIGGHDSGISNNVVKWLKININLI